MNKQKTTHQDAAATTPQQAHALLPIERHPLQPFLPKESKLLMLGSFPPPKKRWAMEFFYPNRSNMMWEMMGLIFLGDSHALTDEKNKTFRLEAIKQLLEEKGIALYDTACAVRRLQNNASDKYLEVVENTDIATLLQRIPLCYDIICTGEKSATVLCEDYHAPLPAIGHFSTLQIGNRTLRLHRMPSTSRAYPLPLEQKAAPYAELFRSLQML